MNDRFKFRVWDFNKKQMFKVIKIAEDWIDVANIYGSVCYKLKIDSNIALMQCTGLKDKNDKLIYEGDLLRLSYNSDILYEIFYDDEIGQYKTRGHFTNNCCGGILWPLKNKLFEIIGNVYENIELLPSQCN